MTEFDIRRPGALLVELPPARVLGGAAGLDITDNLRWTADGKLDVNTAASVEQDNTRPVTSAAVYVEIGNIEALLASL